MRRSLRNRAHRTRHRRSGLEAIQSVVVLAVGAIVLVGVHWAWQAYLQDRLVTSIEESLQTPAEPAGDASPPAAASPPDSSASDSSASDSSASDSSASAQPAQPSGAQPHPQSVEIPEIPTSRTTLLIVGGLIGVVAWAGKHSVDAMILTAQLHIREYLSDGKQYSRASIVAYMKTQRLLYRIMPGVCIDALAGLVARDKVELRHSKYMICTADKPGEAAKTSDSHA